MTRWIFLFVGIIAIAVSAADPPTTKRTSDQTAAQIHKSYWMEVSIEDRGKLTDDPFKLACFGYKADEIAVWGRRGELSIGRETEGEVLVRADTDPMQIDFSFADSKGQRWVTPGIFKYEGAKLVIVEPTQPSVHKFRKDGVYPNRPKDFTVSKENKHMKRILVARQLYDQD